MRPGTTWRLPCAIALAVLGFSGAARAAGEPAGPIVLRWTAPPGCPAAAEVGAEIDRALGGAPDPASPRHLQAEAVVSRAGKDGFRVHLVTDMGGSVGQRDFGGLTCAAVARATALIVALTFDPEAVARQSAEGTPSGPVAAPPEAPPVVPALPVVAAPVPAPAPLPSPPPPSPAPPSPPLPSPLPAPAARPASAAPRLALGVVTEASVGALPAVGVGFGGRASLRLGRLSVDLSAAYWPNRAAISVASPSAGGNVRLFAGDARACYAFALARLELGPCAGLELGRIAADGFGVRTLGSGSALWIAPLVEATAALRLQAHLALRLDLGALVPIERPTFTLQRVGDVFQPAAAVGRASLGAEVRF